MMTAQDEMAEGWMALYICIVKPSTPEQAFDALEGKRTKRRWTDEDITRIKKYRQEGHTWREVAEVMHTSEWTAKRIFKYYRRDEGIKNERRHYI